MPMRRQTPYSVRLQSHAQVQLPTTCPRLTPGYIAGAYARAPMPGSWTDSIYGTGAAHGKEG